LQHTKQIKIINFGYKNRAQQAINPCLLTSSHKFISAIVGESKLNNYYIENLIS